MTLALARARVPHVAVPSAWWADLAATGGLLAFMAFEYSWGPRADDGYRFGPVGVSVVFSVLTILPVAVRRIAPVTALGVSVAAIAVPRTFHPVWSLFWGGFMVVLFLLYTVARHRPWRVATAAGLLPLLALVALHFGAGPAPENPVIADLAFLVTFELFVVGFGVALRRAAMQEERLSDALAQLEAEQAERERVAVLEVRRGLARDLHDVVAHAVSLMLVQAGAARLSIDDDPESARRSLRAIARVGRDARTDLDALVAVLESTGAGTTAAGGLDAVQELIADVRAAGLDLEVRTSGTRPDLSPGLDRAAYRIVQECLTNVVKHAGPTEAVLELRYGDPVRIVVRDAGPRGPRRTPPSSGLGLAGLRERAALFDGRVEAGPLPGGGWAVEVELPVPESS